MMELVILKYECKNDQWKSSYRNKAKYQGRGTFCKKQKKNDYLIAMYFLNPDIVVNP